MHNPLDLWNRNEIETTINAFTWRIIGTVSALRGTEDIFAEASTTTAGHNRRNMKWEKAKITHGRPDGRSPNRRSWFLRFMHNHLPGHLFLFISSRREHGVGLGSTILYAWDKEPTDWFKVVANIKNGNIFEPNNAFSRLATHDKASAFSSRIKCDMRPVRSSGMNYLDGRLGGACTRWVRYFQWIEIFIYPFVVILSQIEHDSLKVCHLFASFDEAKLSMQLKGMQ